MRYVVLLRGVNVGGHKRVPKDEFKHVLEQLGCKDVVTHINSGNAVFTHDKKIKQLTIQNALEAHFGFSIPTLLLTGDEVVHIADSIPSDWTNDKVGIAGARKSDVLYLFDDINDQSIIDKIGYNEKIESMIFIKGAVIYSIYRKDQNKSSLQKLIGTSLYHQMTIRNVNTARKLKELVNK